MKVEGILSEQNWSMCEQLIKEYRSAKGDKVSAAFLSQIQDLTGKMNDAIASLQLERDSSKRQQARQLRVKLQGITEQLWRASSSVHSKESTEAHLTEDNTSGSDGEFQELEKRAPDNSKVVEKGLEESVPCSDFDQIKDKIYLNNGPLSPEIRNELQKLFARKKNLLGILSEGKAVKLIRFEGEQKKSYDFLKMGDRYQLLEKLRGESLVSHGSFKDLKLRGGDVLALVPKKEQNRRKYNSLEWSKEIEKAWLIGELESQYLAPAIVADYPDIRDGHAAEDGSFAIRSTFMGKQKLLQKRAVGDLENLTRQGKLNEKQRRQAAISIAKGLRDLHKKNIVHRDIKLLNALLFRDGSVKIIDFGATEELYSEKQRVSSGVGTHAYLAPEGFSNKPFGHAKAVDCFALAICVHELLFNINDFHRLHPCRFDGKLFDSNEIKQRLEANIHEAYKNRSDFLAKLVRAGLDFDPQNRPSAEKFVEVLENRAIVT